MTISRAQRNKGFTLIELLVVIAIIALLSTVVLASLDTAREKGRNTKRNSMALEYINALELYRSDNDTYPDVGKTTDRDGMYCIGEWGENCYQGWFADNNILNTSLEEHIPGPPKNDTPINFGVLNFSGTVYGCYRTDISYPCNEYELWWYLEGSETEVNCIRGMSPEEGDPAQCRYKSYEDTI